MKEIIELFKRWKCDKDEEYRHNEIHEFVNTLSRGDLLIVFENLETQKEDSDMIFSELRGLLKEHAQFPKLWHTDTGLREWLKEKGEL
ncbi:MAG: hypothetical protein PHT07_24390 [Paludibacter sp.]|nr:hypothetical protein [Paludibacter sp.]